MAVLATLDRSRQRDYLQAKPLGASKENENRALALCILRQNKMRPTESARDTLWELAAKYDKGVGRRWKSQNVLHNREFLIAFILDGEGLADVVPPSWREPMADRRKRSRRVAFVEAAVPVQQPAIDFDVMDAIRCVT